MDISPENIERTVSDILNQIGLNKEPAGPPAGSGKYISGCLFDTIEEAVLESRAAQRRLIDLGLDARKAVISSMRAAALANAQALGELAVRETGLGRMPDKRLKIELAARKTPGPEDITPEAFSGDHGLSITEMAPYGVVATITPSTNPASTVVNNAISIISAGNAVVFNGHPSAREVTNQTIRILHDAAIAAGAPNNVICGIKNPGKESASALMRSRDIDLLLVTGGSEVVHLAMTSGLRAICAGPGNPPVVVDETADIRKAARDIVFGAGFDNNVLCTSEKETFAVDKIFNSLKKEMTVSGGYELTGPELARVMARVVVEDSSRKGVRFPKVNKEFVGKDASVIARAVGVNIPLGTKLLFFEAEWDHPLVMAEQLMPVHPVVRCKDVHTAMELAVLAEHKFEHTFVMHSTNVANLSQMARMCNANIFVKNGPSLAGLGLNAEGYCSLSIAGTTGEGMTRARSFTRPRRCTLVDYFRII